MQNNNAPLTISANRGIYITANGAYFRTGWTNGSDNTTIDSIISGPGPLTQVNDSSTLVLANTGNTYTGVTTFGSTNANFGYSNGALLGQHYQAFQRRTTQQRRGVEQQRIQPGPRRRRSHAHLHGRR